MHSIHCIVAAPYRARLSNCKADPLDFRCRLSGTADGQGLSGGDIPI